MKIRKIHSVTASRPTIEGAGVRLKRAFGSDEVPMLDPFLLLDDFHSEDPGDYIAGFPWHPHRGMETVTYMISGRVKHEDSLGNAGVIGPGDVQWMTAGSGIIHSEMPERTAGLLQGFQLWVNLPAKNKMMDPRYRDITSAMIPSVEVEGGSSVKIICGEANGVRGPAEDIVMSPEYIDVSVPAGASFSRNIVNGNTSFAYVFQGEGLFGPDMKPVSREHLVIFEKTGEMINVKAGKYGVRFLLVSGMPIGEPVAWHGPIVMNSDEELRIAFDEFNNGTFLKKKKI